MPKPSSRSRPPAVKARFLPSPGRPRRDPLEGWQPAVVLVAFAALVALVAVPRPVEPDEALPDPRVDRRELARVTSADDALAAAAEQERLDIDVRELGSAYRAYGRADRAGQAEDLGGARRRLADVAGRALKVGEIEVAKLRAFEQRSLLRELRRWEATGEETDELVELGGSLLHMLGRNGWLVEPPVAPRRHIRMDDAALRVVFKKRWGQITGLEGGPIAVTLDEERVLAGFLLRHPPSQVAAAADGPTGTPGASKPAGPDAELDAVEQRRLALVEGYRLKKVDELSRVDPAYPAALARGMLAYRMGRFPLAVEQLRRHLEAAPDGRFALRATNYLRAALERAGED